MCIAFHLFERFADDGPGRSNPLSMESKFVHLNLLRILGAKIQKPSLKMPTHHSHPAGKGREGGQQVSQRKSIDIGRKRPARTSFSPPQILKYSFIEAKCRSRMRSWRTCFCRWSAMVAWEKIWLGCTAPPPH